MNDKIQWNSPSQKEIMKETSEKTHTRTIKWYTIQLNFIRSTEEKTEILLENVGAHITAHRYICTFITHTRTSLPVCNNIIY